MRFTGSGGQGVILCSIVLAEAAFLAGKNVAQSQSYGPEARGGLCRAELIVDDEKIVYPRVTRADFLLALTQESLDKYGSGMNGLIVTDESLKATGKAVALPILRTASEVVGNPMTANIVAAGAVNALLGIVPDVLLERAMLMNVPSGTERANLAALRAGRRLIGESAGYSSV